PSAHDHMGGIQVDSDMRTGVPHLFAAGEAVGGANGANRLSGNAISEALVFGRRAGLRAAALAAKASMPPAAPMAPLPKKRPPMNPAAQIVHLQALMNEHVGPLRTRVGLERALAGIRALRRFELPAPGAGLDPEW